MKFKSKLYLSFGVILLAMTIFFGIVVMMLDQQTQNMNEIVRERYEAVKMASIIENETNNTGRLLRSKILDPKGQVSNAELDSFEESRFRVTQAIDSFYSTGDTDINKLVTRLKMLNQSYTEAGKAVVDLVKEEKEADAAELLLNNNMETRYELLKVAMELKESQEKAMENVIEDSIKVYERDIQLILGFAILIMVFGIGIMSLAINSIGGILKKVTKVISNIDYESVEQLPRLDIATTDEIGEIAKAFNEMASSLEKKALSEKEFTTAIQEEKWLKTQIAEITTMYQGVNDLKTLAELFLKKLSKLVGVGYAAFYWIEGEKQSKWLTKIATYAHDNQQVGKDKIYFGEGLVGQCAIDNKGIIIEQIPEEYCKISSGLGNTKPRSLAIFPMEFEGQVTAVIELASLYPFKPLEIKLLQELLGNLGITMNSITGYMKIERLLKESQALTEELQVQSEELNVQQEELRSINEKLEEQYKSSDQKTLELEKIKEALEEQNRQVLLSSKYKSEFLANMSHELRTPLNSLLILGQMLAENSDKNLTEKQVDYANTICSSGRDLLLLIDEILDLSKVEAGKMDINYEEVEVSEVKGFIEKQFTPLASNKGLNFKVECEQGLPERILTDSQRLFQILKNLVSNAIKFTDTGQVTLSISCFESLIVFAVNDTGVGIPKHKQQIIFEAFQQADGTTGRKYGGTGLGLSISRELAYLLGGYIEVESVEGQGSTFSFYIPNLVSSKKVFVSEVEVAAGDFEDLRPETVNREILHGKKILIVDDDMRNIYALTTALEAKEMEVLFTENGQEALTVLRDNTDIDLVLMDIMMPEMDGYQAMEEIRKNPNFGGLPIIALTAKAMKQDREKCITAGASDYICKPVNLEQLFSLMTVWLQ